MFGLVPYFLNSHQALRSRVPWGQNQFQQLLNSQAGPGSGSGAGAGVEVEVEAEDVELEELRYRWMLHKSKVKDVGDLRERLRVAVSPALTSRGQ